MGINWTTVKPMLQIELGDSSGVIWTEDNLLQQTNKAIDWLNTVLPQTLEESFTTSEGQTEQQIGLLFAPAVEVRSVFLNGVRLTQLPDPADTNPNSGFDTVANSALTWRVVYEAGTNAVNTVVRFSRPLTGSSEVGAGLLKVSAVFPWVNLSTTNTTPLPASALNVLVMKAAQFCHQWAAPVMARAGADLGSAAAVDRYDALVNEMVAALMPRPPQSRPLPRSRG